MNSLFERIMREKIALMIDMRVEALTVTGVTTFELYEYNMGYLRALRDILSTMEEIEE